MIVAVAAVVAVLLLLQIKVVFTEIQDLSYHPGVGQNIALHVPPRILVPF